MIMDSRSQGSAWRTGDTPDTGSSGSPRVPGFLTDGLPDRDAYCYRRLFTDVVRAVEAAAQLPHSDPTRPVTTGTTGTSQGGARAIAAPSLHSGVTGAMPNVPFLCDIRRAASAGLLRRRGAGLARHLPGAPQRGAA